MNLQKCLYIIFAVLLTIIGLAFLMVPECSVSHVTIVNNDSIASFELKSDRETLWQGKLEQYESQHIDITLKTVFADTWIEVRKETLDGPIKSEIVYTIPFEGEQHLFYFKGEEVGYLFWRDLDKDESIWSSWNSFWSRTAAVFKKVACVLKDATV